MRVIPAIQRTQYWTIICEKHPAKVFDVSLSSLPAAFSHRKRREMENIFANGKLVTIDEHLPLVILIRKLG